jgi:hypothetical protein
MRQGRLDPAATIPRLADAVEPVRTDTGALRLRGPLLRRSAFSRGMAWMMRLPGRFEVELDDIGTFVIERCDGRTLDRLASDVAAHLRLSRREAETALADFFAALIKRRLAVLESGARTGA